MLKSIVRVALAVIAVVVVVTGLYVLNFFRTKKTETVTGVTANYLGEHVRKKWYADKVLLTDEEIRAVAWGINPPNSSTGLIMTDRSGAPLDRWGRRLIITTYRDPSSIRIEVLSLGADGRQDTDDDIRGQTQIMTGTPK